MKSFSEGGLIAIVVLLFSEQATGSNITVGPLGINSTSALSPTGSGLQLAGTGISIGQVETGRPAVIGVDSATNTDVIPTAVTYFAGQAVTMGDADMDLDNGHPTQVASVMISIDSMDDSVPPNGEYPIGVAQSASLYSSAFISGLGPNADEDALVTMQYVSGIGGMRAVNHSWGLPRASGAPLDGNSKLSLGTDWLAGKYPNVLQVIAGNEDTGGIPLPTDSYNGIVVASSQKSVVDGVYRQLADHNFYGEDAFGPRTSVALLAPGEDVELGTLTGVKEGEDGGTSFAAPHVTGTVALLQEFAENRITSVGSPRWTQNARRHEVMKAVLINSADKVQDNGDGNYLGMEKTVVDDCDETGVNCTTWFETAAFLNDGPVRNLVSASK